MKKIYVIQAIYLEKNEFIIDRIWGWFSSKKEAINSIMMNDFDIFEDNYYNIIILEEVHQGLGQVHKLVGFYKRSKNKSTFTVREIKVPKNIANNICNFTMG